MGSWMLLLLHFHLVLCVPLPVPSNVSISSFNMEHTLSFLPGPETPSSTRFKVEVLRFRKKSWREVADCSKLTAGQTCNLTRAIRDPFDYYQARVRAFAANRTSNWTVSEQFQPLSDTVLGPPDVSVSGCGNCLLLHLRVPPIRGLQQLQDFHGELVFHVRRTRDGAQFGLNLQYEEEIVITYLEPGVEYCVTVAVKTLFNSHSVTSKPHCAFTSPPPSSSLYVVYGLLGAFSALGFLLLGLVVYCIQLGVKRRRPPGALSYLLLQGLDHGGAPPELSGQISAMQLHKEGSVDCLLTAHRPVQPLRSSSEEEEDCGQSLTSDV
ncbi:interferon alpha/beta receptor 2-like isoform X2 [Chaetodon trifascialis]|uniref:interferon alpha/beta receptor 2-like isoform X2 n=1 Tax=Chaetodon trifascialis TaxID=109706 RepID=UPI003996264D